LGLLSANITIYNVTGIISEPQKLPDIVEFTLFTSGSALEHEPSKFVNGKKKFKRERFF
jgi:hypothetical protein